MNPQALNEAKFFMASVRNGSQSIDQARQEIGNHNEHRRNVRLALDRKYMEFLRRKRRLTEETKQRIRTAIADPARTMLSIEREFDIDFKTVKKFRTDTEDRRLRTKYPPETYVQAERDLRAGSYWRDVASSLGMSPQTLLRHVPYRKKANAHEPQTA